MVNWAYFIAAKAATDLVAVIFLLWHIICTLSSLFLLFCYPSYAKASVDTQKTKQKNTKGSVKRESIIVLLIIISHVHSASRVYTLLQTKVFTLYSCGALSTLRHHFVKTTFPSERVTRYLSLEPAVLLIFCCTSKGRVVADCFDETWWFLGFGNFGFEVCLEFGICSL